MHNERINLRCKLLSPHEVGVEEGLEVFLGTEPFVAVAVGIPAIPVVGPAEGLVFLNRHGTRRTWVCRNGLSRRGYILQQTKCR